MKKFLIAGATSGVGKTSATLGIISALVQRGYSVQPYKVGPDYVDTKFHSRVSGHASRNVDDYLIPDDDTLKYLFEKDTQDIDLGIVEGVMGLYDGLGSDKDAHSTASMAKKLDLPVILIVSGKSISTSTAAVVKGFVDFDSEVNIAGVIINNVMSENHFNLIKAAVNRYCPNTPVLGYMKFNKELELPSRQLGLVPDDEVDSVDKKIQGLSKIVSETIDLDAILKLASSSKLEYQGTFENEINKLHPNKISIGIAKDEAFNFYYRDNLELLENLGVKLVPFSPVADKSLPDVDALWLGGGYPEEKSQQLADNTSMKQQIRDFSNAGKPIFAECGGLMYLGKDLNNEDGSRHEMAGIFDGSSHMTKRLRKFGYCQAIPEQDCFIGIKGSTVYGHEFHHSTFEPNSPESLKTILTMEKYRDGVLASTWVGGYQYKHTFASYLHIHFYQSVELAKAIFKSMGVL
ncbi:cobyrinate a,c-diamide synthase [Companilactobacillus ginsenosidimutans]|uniref:Cobyrinate a,c-diamide synthase n=1 Tax=Companilactobacillus ginsenosidimutans TaxID=1007676 RepID=A0A0H4QGS2_9LACO|nr:cobyrinate a,c-diamide synthase [Companilactobacillus ginsenosidimutans]AKP66206.1 cobyrinic acid a,c-diamide synthase [Companilactobacillus ginsenosidimutans]